MDEATLRERIQRHADAVLRGDMETAMADTDPEFVPRAGPVGAAMPQGIVSAEVVNVEIGDPTTVAEIHYRGEDGKTATIRSHWEERDGEPRVVFAEPV